MSAQFGGMKDILYGSVRLPPVCMAFMDVPEFQRLRRVKQLGMVHYVYPSAVHSRFEHSIGVCILAGKAVDQLRQFVCLAPTVTPFSTAKLGLLRTKHLIQLAALYHDIGHFAYSHLFDTFLRTAEPKTGEEKREDESEPKTGGDGVGDGRVGREDGSEGGGEGGGGSLESIFAYTDHEDRSVYLMRQVNARLEMLSSAEEQFVAHCILGVVPAGEPAYLYEVVANRRCGIDVDRLDYLARDAFHCGLPSFESDLILKNLGIAPNGHLAFDSRIRNEIHHVYRTRKYMFEVAYQHRTNMQATKIHFCMMRRLGSRLFQYGARTDDHNLDTLFRSTLELAHLLTQLDTRQLDHDCRHCAPFKIENPYRPSGHLHDVYFI